MMTLKELGQELINLPNNNYIITDAEVHQAVSDQKKYICLYLKRPYSNDNNNHIKIYLED